jgi:hypothetical protein
MDRRRIGAGLLVLASSLLLLTGTASANVRPASTPPPGTCTIKSLPSFTAQGEFSTSASVADIVEVGCDPFVYGAGSKVSITAAQLYSRCGGEVDWIVPNPYKHVYDSRSVEIELDPDGNGTVAILAGPVCAAGESLVTVHELEEPYESFTTSYTVLPPEDTPLGVTALPASQIEDSTSSAVATIIETEIPGASEKKLRLSSEELFARCHGQLEESAGVVTAGSPSWVPGIIWITEDGDQYYGPEVNGIELDNNGNAFVIALGEDSCFPGTSLIEADLESKPFTTLTTEFTILSPRPRV